MTKKYKDITIEWIENATPNTHKVKNQLYFKHKNKKYYVDKKNVVLDYTKKEKEIAIWLENNFGGEIYMLPRINYPEGIQTADYLFRNEYWDLKEITGQGKNILYHAIEDHKKQATNFIFDFSKSSLTDAEIFTRISKLYTYNKVSWLNKIIIKREDKIICIIKRDNPSD